MRWRWWVASAWGGDVAYLALHSTRGGHLPQVLVLHGVVNAVETLQLICQGKTLKARFLEFYRLNLPRLLRGF